MKEHVLEVKEQVQREGRELSLDTAAQEGTRKLFALVAEFLGQGVQYPREADIAFSWLQGEVDAEHETWIARAEIFLHPPRMEVENPHHVPMDNRINAEAG